MDEVFHDHGPLSINPPKCANCGSPLNWLELDLELIGVPTAHKCRWCNNEVDIYPAILNVVRENFMLTQAYWFLGAKTNVFRIHIKANELFRLEFEKYDVPKSARILSVNYTPQGSLFPLEMHGNVPSRFEYFDNTVVLGNTPMPIDQLVEKEVDVSVSVTWIERNSVDHAFDSLIDAFTLYSHGKLPQTVIPANLASEEPAGRFVSTALKSRALPKNAVENFLSEAATYYHQLNVIAPLLCDVLSLPRLDPRLLGPLNALRKHRNEFAHSGRLRTELDNSTAAEMLTAALFSNRYFTLLSRLLEKANGQN